MGLETNVYLDSCVAIYLVEEIEPYASFIRRLTRNTAGPNFIISSLTKMECLVMPMRNADKAIQDKFVEWFTKLETLTVTDADFLAAARLRAANASLKTPDALHLAVAARRNCDQFWTNDDRLSKLSPMPSININNTVNDA